MRDNRYIDISIDEARAMFENGEDVYIMHPNMEDFNADSIPSLVDELEDIVDDCIYTRFEDLDMIIRGVNVSAIMRMPEYERNQISIIFISSILNKESMVKYFKSGLRHNNRQLINRLSTMWAIKMSDSYIDPKYLEALNKWPNIKILYETVIKMEEESNND